MQVRRRLSNIKRKEPLSDNIFMKIARRQPNDVEGSDQQILGSENSLSRGEDAPAPTSEIRPVISATTPTVADAATKALSSVISTSVTSAAQGFRPVDSNSSDIEFSPSILNSSPTINILTVTNAIVARGAPASPTITHHSATNQAQQGAMSTTPSPSPSPSANPGEDKGRDNGAVIGGVVGGGLVIIIAAFILGFYLRRRARKKRFDPNFAAEVEKGSPVRAAASAQEKGLRPVRSREEEEKKLFDETMRKITGTVVPDIIEPVHIRNRSLDKAISQSREGLLSGDRERLGLSVYANRDPRKRTSLDMLRRSTAQDSATIPSHLQSFRPESVSTDGQRLSAMNHLEDPSHAGERISKIGMALSTSDSSVQDDNISAILHEEVGPNRGAQVLHQGDVGDFLNNSLYFEDSPPSYSSTHLHQGSRFEKSGGGHSKHAKSNSNTSTLPHTLNSVESSRFAGRSTIDTPTPPGTPTRSEHDASSESRHSSRRNSRIFGLANAISSKNNTKPAETSASNPKRKSWERRSRRWDKNRHSRGRATGAPIGLEKKKPNKSRSRSRGNAMWTAWFDSSSDGEGEPEEDVVEPIPLPGGIVTSKSHRKRRNYMGSGSTISHSTISTNQMPDTSSRV